MLEDEIEKKINLKKDQRQLVLTFETRDLDHDFGTNPIKEKS
jgi:hypothetical protein